MFSCGLDMKEVRKTPVRNSRALGHAARSNTSEIPPSKERGGRVVLKKLWSEK